jgi:TetR/AcrR family transcriptional repressor of lmrAB and yxaGH operons
VPRSDSRQRLLDAAALLIQERGYHATGLRDVLAASGAPRGSLYFHFPEGKDQLAAEAVQLSAERVCALTQQVLAESEDLRQGVLTVVGLFADQLERSGYRLGCPIAPAAVPGTEGDLLPDVVRQAFDSWQQVITDRLRGAGLEPERAERLACFALSTVEGAVLLSRVRRDVTPLRGAGTELVALLEMALPGSARTT